MIYVLMLRLCDFASVMSRKDTGNLSSLSFLGAFAKLRKATIRFVMSVRPFVYPSVSMEQLGSH
jgi:hypothetical protein